MKEASFANGTVMTTGASICATVMPIPLQSEKQPKFAAVVIVLIAVFIAAGSSSFTVRDTVGEVASCLHAFVVMPNAGVNVIPMF